MRPIYQQMGLLPLRRDKTELLPDQPELAS
jgi:hypothetical protein